MFVHSRTRTLAGQKYQVEMPLESHWGPSVSCEAIRCKALLNPTGWKTWADVGSTKETTIRQEIKKRGWTFEEDVVGDTVFFYLPPGTPCFVDGHHRGQIEREAILTHHNRTTGKRTQMYGADLYERWEENLDDLARERQ